MDIKKRDFLTAGMVVGAGLAAGAAQAAITPNGQGVPKAAGRSMLDSPNFFGDASKGGGFNKSWARSLPQVASVDPNYKPRRVNKAIELWEDNQVAFYNVYMPSGAPDGYEEGKRLSQTYCDAIDYEMENGSLDFSNLRNFMQGLVDGGPTPSGHRTPMVFVTLPAVGFDGPLDARQCLADPAGAGDRRPRRADLRDAFPRSRRDRDFLRPHQVQPAGGYRSCRSKAAAVRAARPSPSISGA